MSFTIQAFFVLIIRYMYQRAVMVSLVPMQSGPSWSHAHNRLTISASFTDGTACKRPHILPKAACLGAWHVQVLGAGSKVPSSRALINNSGYTSHARKWQQQ